MAFIGGEKIKVLLKKLIVLGGSIMGAIILLKGGLIWAAHTHVLADGFYNVQHIALSDIPTKLWNMRSFYFQQFTITYPFVDAGYLTWCWGVELVLNIAATILLCQLPKIATPQRPKKSLKEIYVNFFRIIVWTLKNGRIRSHIVLAAFLWGATALFIWSFQPMMQLLLIPVSMFGVVYFMNHACRMTFSGKTGTLTQYLTIKQLGMISFVWYVFGFVLSVMILWMQPLPLMINLGYFLFIAIGTGGQIAYGNVHLGRLHKIVPKDIRATASSVSFMMGRLFCAFFLISLKFLIKDFSLMMSMGICGVLFLCGIFPLKKVCSIWAKEEGEKVCS